MKRELLRLHDLLLLSQRKNTHESHGNIAPVENGGRI